MQVTAIVVGGGRGQRFGGAEPKQFLDVAGRTMLERSVEAFARHPQVSEIVVALPEELVQQPPAWMARLGGRLRVVAGGARRQDSVANAFRAVSPQSRVIVIHDAARPFVTQDLITRTIAAAAESGAAVAALPVNDTVKRGRGGVVQETLPREEIFLAQTPQAFLREVLGAALALGADVTDEAALVERLGGTVRLVAGEPTNIKITVPGDLARADAIARELSGAGAAEDGEAGGAMRVGIGYDLHRLVDGRPLILGGVRIPFDRGLLGHSDADAVCHAATEAVLGAAACDNIGHNFPNTDPRWKGASSIDLLQRAVGEVHDRGYVVSNVDVVVIAEQPKLAPFVQAMRENVARAVGVEVDRVSIKGKTNEGVGDIGRGEAIAAHAVAMLRPVS
jgi:2-C-methyl-D-erythritol 4-phosphate cytidylyltransferase/2-C-methyl-D-erythritol 2,4-cyclodiphosphate synthase